MKTSFCSHNSTSNNTHFTGTPPITGAPDAEYAWLSGSHLLLDCGGSKCEEYHACAAKVHGGALECLKVTDDCATFYDEACSKDGPKLKFHLVKKASHEKEKKHSRGYGRHERGKSHDKDNAKDGDCMDSSKDCCYWANLGECETNPFWMRPNCQKACGTCGCTVDGALQCEVKVGDCQQTDNVMTTAEAPETTAAPTTEMPAMTTAASESECEDTGEHCKYWADIGECEKNPFWMKPNCQKSCGSCGTEVGDVDKPGAVEGCQNKHHLCQFWFTLGECDLNPDYMNTECKLSCDQC